MADCSILPAFVPESTGAQAASKAKAAGENPAPPPGIANTGHLRIGKVNEVGESERVCSLATDCESTRATRSNSMTVTGPEHGRLVFPHLSEDTRLLFRQKIGAVRWQTIFLHWPALVVE